MLPFVEDIPSFAGRIAIYGILFLLGCVLLESGADRFVDSTAILARRLHIPQFVIALLTAGAEWEELAVVVVAVAQGHANLGLGNVVGSCTANILGSFSLGLLFPRQMTMPAEVTTSAKVYATLMIMISVLVGGLAWGNIFTPAAGIGLIGIFAVYIVLIAYGIYRGIMGAPEASDSDSSSESDSEDEAIANNSLDVGRSPAHSHTPSASTPLLPNREIRYPKYHSNTYHVLAILLSLLALSLSGYLLAGSSTAFASAAGLSDTIVGLTLLSFTTTLPEKLVAIIAARRGQTGIFVANTVGSNVFLLTLVLGITLVTGKIELDERTRWFDVMVMVVSSLAFAVVIWMGLLRRWVGSLMVLAYIGYLVGNVIL